MNKKILKDYADIVVKTGLNVQKGEPVYISAPVHTAEFVEQITESAYKNGAKRVTVFWTDDKVTRLDYKYQSVKELENVPKWFADSRNGMLDDGGVFLGILSDNPMAFKGVNPKKIARARRAIKSATKPSRDARGANRQRWCLIAYPEKNWAKKMFPELSSANAYKKQFEYIIKSMRLDAENPYSAWREHKDNLKRRSKILNDAKIKTFHYKNSIGTDFSISMPKNYIFCGAEELGVLDGVWFTANMPTEEVFSSPDRMTANGKLVASMPLTHNGIIIENFGFTFKDGQVVDFFAEKGYDTLKEILETDEGSKRLGEIALIGKNSPIHKLGRLFYETLFDENASCHFALGDSYCNCLQGGADMDEETLKRNGLNVSLEHVDFMVGTDDLEITATCEDGRTLQVFKDGEWVF